MRCAAWRRGRLRVDSRRHNAPAAEDAKGCPFVGEADAPGVEELVVFAEGEAEGRGPLLEELTLLGKEEAEAVEVHLQRVGLHLGEVGIDRQIQGEVAGEPVLHVESHLP